ncbi:MAG: argininosuccinate lyase [Thermodesulfobacteriota bacterium]
MSSKLWGGRFSEKTDKAVEKFSSSIETDSKLYKEDITGSIAHSQMLADCKIISQKEADDIKNGLLKIEKKIDEGDFVHDDSLEDIHMHIESYLTEAIGDTGKKLHTARSRNDQIALDNRLYLKNVVNTVLKGLYYLRKGFAELAEKNIDAILPGYTHMQRAQPVSFAHHMLAYYEMFTRDAQRFEDSLKRIDVNPLGCAALAGTPHNIDREKTTSALGFSDYSKNSMDAVSDRDYIIEFLSSASITMMHLSRISEELILWSTSEFSFVTLSDAFTTGSSIMPQKKNPDIPELVRGKTGRVYGNLVSVLTLMKSLPMAYNRDMQEDKPPLIDGAETLISCIDIYKRMLPGIKVNRKRMLEATKTGFLNATDMADYLVEKNIAFRQAHEITGKAVALALDKGCELENLSLSDLQGISEIFDKDIYNFLDIESVVDRRVSAGGTSRQNIRKELKEVMKKLELEKDNYN